MEPRTDPGMYTGWESQRNRAENDFGTATQARQEKRANSTVLIFTFPWPYLAIVFNHRLVFDVGAASGISLSTL